MEIVEIDVLDGRGVIPVAVCSYIEALRLRQYIRNAKVAFEQAEIQEQSVLASIKDC
jgi:hypothetical protein